MFSDTKKYRTQAKKLNWHATGLSSDRNIKQCEKQLKAYNIAKLCVDAACEFSSVHKKKTGNCPKLRGADMNKLRKEVTNEIEKSIKDRLRVWKKIKQNYINA